MEIKEREEFLADVRDSFLLEASQKQLRTILEAENRILRERQSPAKARGGIILDIAPRHSEDTEELLGWIISCQKEAIAKGKSEAVIFIEKSAAKGIVPQLFDILIVYTTPDNPPRHEFKIVKLE